MIQSRYARSCFVSDPCLILLKGKMRQKPSQIILRRAVSLFLKTYSLLQLPVPPLWWGDKRFCRADFEDELGHPVSLYQENLCSKIKPVVLMDSASV